MKSKKKLVHVVECFAGGVLDFLSDFISAIPPERYEIVIVHGIRPDTPKNYVDFFPSNVTFVEWAEAKREVSILADMKAGISLVRLVRQLNPDILHLHSSKAGFLGRVFSRFYSNKVKIYYTTHGVSSLRQDVSKRKQFFFKSLEKIGSLFGGIVICCSASEAEHMKAYGVSASYIFNGIALPACKEIMQLDKSLKLDKAISVITVARVAPQKNARLFSRIAHKMGANNDVTVNFTWVGDGEDAYLLNEHVMLTGWKAKPDAVTLLNMADIYCSTSLWEGLPLSVIQAMALAKPLVLSSCTGNIDLVVNGVNGFICYTEDEYIKAIQCLASDEELRTTMGEASRQIFLEKFTLESMVFNYLKIYEN
jgi:glycosyltransferase involved in cell wall biosynthesis